ncbi:MAG: DUF1559 domain-containing protein [Planctomycetaceae bacterium]|nr:DUF1559 domain-containing protein [Planctomycetaceae bacterium]
MNTVGLGMMELVLVAATMFGGGTFAVPHGPDAGLDGAVPAECLLYAAYNGIAPAKAESGNQVEQLLAEPEVAAFVAELDRLIDEGIDLAPARDEQERTIKRLAPTVARTLLTRPSMLYLAKVALPPEQPSGNGAIVVNAGERTKEFMAALEELEALYLEEVPANLGVEKSTVDGVELRKLPTPPQAPPVAWGNVDTYVFLAFGEGEAESVVKRLKAKPAATEWLTKLRAELGVERLGSVVYLDAGAIVKTVEPLFPLLAAEAPPPLKDLGKLLDQTGLRGLRHAAVAFGLDKEMSVSKIVVGHDGEPKGLLKLGGATPLTLDDVKSIPRSADFAAVARFDAQGVFAALRQVAEQIEPQAGARLDQALGQAQEQLGFSIEKDLLAGLGDTWTIYNSCEEGGLLLTGLCATVGVRDRAKVEKVLERALRLVEAETRENDKPVFRVRKTEAAGKTISYVQVVGPSPVAPAWCFDGERLIVAASPQMVRTHLARGADAGSLADVEAVKAHLATGDVTSLTYQNTQLGLQLLYSYAQYMATVGAGMLESETGLRADISKFPSFGAISRHMRPSISLTRHTKNAIVVESHSVGPSLSLPFVGGMMAGFLTPAVYEAQGAAKRAVGSNNLRNIGMAAIMYASEKGSLPTNIVDEGGKPLLSWRVRLLPHLDQQALYERFHLDEPWDSAHNRTLIANMPDFYRHTGVVLAPGAEGRTLYQMPSGPGTLYDSKKLSLDQIGAAGIATSQAALVVVAEPQFAVEWTKPSDLEIDLQNYLERLLLDRNRAATVLRLDGSVHEQPAASAAELEESLFPR